MAILHSLFYWYLIQRPSLLYMDQGQALNFSLFAVPISEYALFSIFRHWIIDSSKTRPIPSSPEREKTNVKQKKSQQRGKGTTLECCSKQCPSWRRRRRDKEVCRNLAHSLRYPPWSAGPIFVKPLHSRAPCTEPLGPLYPHLLHHHFSTSKAKRANSAFKQPISTNSELRPMC